MKPNVIQPGKYYFAEPLEYVPVARFEALLARFREQVDETAQLKQELAKTTKELAQYRNLMARSGK